MSLPKFYFFDMSLPGELYVHFDEHINHAQNMREHLEGFSRTPENEFVLHGSVDGNTILYANGDPRRMKDGVILLFVVKDNRTLEVGDWAREGSIWPKSTEELEGFSLRVPGRWLTEEESALKWLSWQGVHDPKEDEIEVELQKRGVHSLKRFSHPGLEARARSRGHL